jgi:hypothetical protein
MDLFLRAKHWQLFVVFIVLPFVIGMAVMINMLTDIVQVDQPDPAAIFSHMKFFPLPFALYVLGKMCWQWAVAIRMQRLAPAGVQFKNTAFKIFFWFTVLFYPLLFVFVFSFITSISATNMPDPSQFIWFIALFPLSFFNTFCMFYCYYYTAKTFKTVELQRQVTFSDFILESVLIWFFFIGVWILQPKINKLTDPDIMPEETA